MSFGVVPNGTVNRIWVGAAAGSATVLVGGLQQYRFASSADTSTEDFYDGFSSITTVGAPVYSGSGSGKWNDGDSGLAIIVAAKETQAIISFAIAPNGTDGQGFSGRVSEFEISGGGVNEAANYSFTVVQADDPFDVGGGLS